MSLLTEAAAVVRGGMPDLSGLLASFASAFTQDSRLLRLEMGGDGGLSSGSLLPHRLKGREGINEGFRYEVEALSSNSFLDLGVLLGSPVRIGVLTDEGDEREICGLVTEARQEGSDGGFATYRLVVESGLAVLSHRRNARVFLDLDVRQVTARILSEHLEDNATLAEAFSLDDRCQGECPVRPFWMQYGESDADYLRRIWAREGLSFVLEPSPESTSAQPQHRLILFDDPYELDPSSASRVRYHRADGTESWDAITRWDGLRRLQSGSTARCAWDHRSAALASAQEESLVRQGSQGDALASTLEDYRHSAPLEGIAPEDVATQTRREMQTREGRGEGFDGESSVRAFQAGTWFTLTQHPIHDQEDPRDREFVVAHLEVEAESNLPKDLKAALPDLLSGALPRPEASPSPYRNRFHCVRRSAPILPEEICPPDPGVIPAQVVGPPGEIVHTDALGRIRVRFLLAREQDHPQAGASGTDGDSFWIRQAETWGSQGFGASFLPRVGDEVAVAFLGGDPDKPVVLGSAHPSARPPASFGGVSSLPSEKVLAGIRSQMHQGSGGNELILDDSSGQLRARLASDHAASSLDLGWLVHPRSGGSSEPRGEGLELRTDAWGSLRASQGLLVTTFPTPGPHLEADPLAAQLASGQSLAQALSGAGEPLGFEKLASSEGIQQLKENAQHRKAQGGSGIDVPAFQGPMLGIAGRDGILSTTPASHALAAGQDLHLSSGGDTSLGVGRRLAMAIKAGWSTFVCQSGIKLFAGKGDFSTQAGEGSIQLLADQNAQITSANGEVKVLAKTYIKLSAGQCQIELTAHDVNLYMPGPLNLKGTVLYGGSPGPAPALPTLPTVSMPETLLRGCLTVRIDDIDPEDPEHAEDVFTLTSSNGQYKQTRTVKEDKVPGDNYLDLEYTDLLPNTCYSLEVKYGHDGTTELLFEDEPVSSLCIL